MGTTLLLDGGLCKIPRSTLWPLPHLRYLQHWPVQQLSTDKRPTATNQTVNISCVPNTVDGLYIDLYIAASLMYISRARKALHNSSSQPPHPLHLPSTTPCLSYLFITYHSLSACILLLSQGIVSSHASHQSPGP